MQVPIHLKTPKVLVLQRLKHYMLFSDVIITFGSFSVAFVYALQQSTMSTYLQLATSSYSKHVIGTISVVVSIMTAVALPFGARLADFASRPAALLMAIVFYAWGYIAAAASNDYLCSYCHHHC
ncbi:uncharacterized protein L203_103189 [Cryptococcus depauperatus CBS 7841]|uniref:Major facilitator superfamily (MFS) profile domain-containing protein n=1 Tax=Cryptococcus depauperatus CBS 7841 TaxID=1295531 RepID=A0AAJ8M1S8_9TREE